jgi:hypothetical protein
MSRNSTAAALVATAAAAFSLSAAVAASAQAASRTSTTKAEATKKVIACVNKKTGGTKVLLGAKAKKHCANGWTKVTWSTAGHNGKNGKNGTNGTTGRTGTDGKSGASGIALQVRDSTGNLLGTFAGVFPGEAFPIYAVLGTDGGLYIYLPDGHLEPTGSPLFKDSRCTGTAYEDLGPAGIAMTGVAGLYIGSARLVYRPSDSTVNFGTPRVWKYTRTTETVPTPVPTVYQLDFSGTCVALDTLDPADLAIEAGDLLIALSSTPAPQDGVGPITLS